MKYLLPILALLLLVSCADEPQNTPKELPNTPESVARQWQDYVDSDRFAEAQTLSTPRAQEWLKMIEGFLAGLPPEETAEPVKTVFTEFNCTESEDTARCGYIISEDGEIIRDTFYLYRIDGQWKVDVPEDLTEEDSSSLEQFIDSLMQEE